MKNLHKSFHSVIAIFLSLGLFAVNTSAQYESSIQNRFAGFNIPLLRDN